MDWGKLSGKARKAKTQTSPAAIRGGKGVQVMVAPWWPHIKRQEALRRPALRQGGTGAGGGGGGQAGPSSDWTSIFCNPAKKPHQFFFSQALNGASNSAL
jgi:hypothetical protein